MAAATSGLLAPSQITLLHLLKSTSSPKQRLAISVLKLAIIPSGTLSSLSLDPSPAKL